MYYYSPLIKCPFQMNRTSYGKLKIMHNFETTTQSKNENKIYKLNRCKDLFFLKWFGNTHHKAIAKIRKPKHHICMGKKSHESYSNKLLEKPPRIATEGMQLKSPSSKCVKDGQKINSKTAPGRTTEVKSIVAVDVNMVNTF